MPAKSCLLCGTEISGQATEGLCPACLLEAGLGSLEGVPSKPPTSAVGSFPQVFGDYELLGEIARGGQGVVYRARHSALGREVALKMFPVGPWTTDGDLQRFRNEARVSAELDHPAIVPTYDVGEVQGQHYFTMKLIDGLGLDRWQPGAAISPRLAAEIIAEAARGVHHAHQRGVLHRDLKPGNILVDAQGRPHITDFGLAKLLDTDSTLTRTSEVLGTPSYISPEVAAGNRTPSSPATDVYGLGAVLYHLLTRNPPFAGGTTLETIRLVVEADPRPPRLWNPKIDRDLETICLKCLEKDPARRYTSAAELADDLDRWLRHEPIRARPGGVGYRMGRWIRRHRVSTAIAAALAFTAIAVGWSWQHANAVAASPYSLAVLLRAADAESGYLAAEYSRDLIHLLGDVPGIKLAPRSETLKWEASTESAQAAGQALRVPHLVFGTLRQAAGKPQFHVELVETSSGRVLWTKTQEGALNAGSELQTQVARAIAAHLGLSLAGKNELRPTLTTNPEAWAHYLRARQLLDTGAEPSLLESVGEFEQAIARDPNFAQAHAGLADAHMMLGYTFREPVPHFAKAKEQVEAALQRDETLADALVAQGVLRYFLDWDWAAAERSVKQALLLDPSKLENHGCYLHCLETVGRVDDALKIVRAAAETHPNSVMIQSELGCATYYAGRFAEAETYWRDVLKKDPDNAYLRWGLARTLAQRQHFAEAVQELETAQTKPSGDWAPIFSELAYVRGRQNWRPQATELIETLRSRAKQEFVDPYLLAMAFAGLGETDQVYAYLNQAIAVRSTWIPSLLVDPKFSALHGDPRFQAMLAQLKVPSR